MKMRNNKIFLNLPEYMRVEEFIDIFKRLSQNHSAFSWCCDTVDGYKNLVNVKLEHSEGYIDIFTLTGEFKGE